MLKSSKNIKTEKILAAEFTCEFCNRSFTRESSLITHSCEKKRRWYSKDAKDVKLGFYVYQRFYEISFKNKLGEKKPFEKFIASQYYCMFVAFGKYLLDIKAIDIEGFIVFVIKGGYKLKDWTDDDIYKIWIKEFGRKESPYVALERNIMLMQQWAMTHHDNWNNFLRNINPQLATQWICDGKISPWLLYSNSGSVLFSRLSDEQLNLMHSIIDPDFWLLKLKNNYEDLKQINEMLKENGI